MKLLAILLITITVLKNTTAQALIEIPEDILRYQKVVDQILDHVLNKNFKGRTYNELAKFIDTFGPRPSGSKVLEDSIDYMINLTKSNGIEDVFTENVVVPHWVRKDEYLIMIDPRYKELALTGLGLSVSTPPEGILADVLTVKSFDDLKSREVSEVRGKMVLFEEEYTTYEKTVPYRVYGAVEAAKKGAVACLIKSVTPFSLYTPHTGALRYESNVTKIPAAAITIEDADLIQRMINRGEKVQLLLNMKNSIDEKDSRNTFINRKGRISPEKLVIVSGHIDSWDIGTGALDDGGGMMISWAVPIILKELGLKPRRTVQSILWTAEEPGFIGAISYAERHKDDLKNINFIMESDEGTFAPRGLAVAGNKRAKTIIKTVLQLFSNINATTFVEQDAPGADIMQIISKGVPGASLLSKNEKYFWFHHSAADQMNVLNSRDLDLCAAFWAAVAYIIADIPEDLQS